MNLKLVYYYFFLFEEVKNGIYIHTNRDVSLA